MIHSGISKPLNLLHFPILLGGGGVQQIATNPHKHRETPSGSMTAGHPPHWSLSVPAPLICAVWALPGEKAAQWLHSPQTKEEQKQMDKRDKRACAKCLESLTDSPCDDPKRSPPLVAILVNGFWYAPFPGYLKYHKANA